MLRTRTLALVVLALAVGCDDGDERPGEITDAQPADAQPADAAPPADAEPAMDAGPDAAPVDPDAASPGDAGIMDAAPMPDAAPDAAPDAQPPDEEAPTVAFTAPTDGAEVFGEVPVSIDAADDRGLASVTVLVDGLLAAQLVEAPYTWQWATGGLADGPYRLTAVAEDDAGNTAEAFLDLRVLDPCVGGAACPPQGVALVAPAAGAAVCGTTRLAATADDAGPITWTFELDGEPLPGDGPWRTWDTTGAENGSHRLRVLAESVGGGRAFDLGTVTVQNPCVEPAPGLVVITPEADALLSADVEITADAPGAAAVRFAVDGAELTVDDAAPFGAPLAVERLADGPHTLQAWAVGPDGQVTAATVAFAVDRTPPTVEIVGPAADAPVAGVVPVVVSAEDAAGVAAVQVTVGDREPVVLDRAPWTLAVDTADLPSGDVPLRVVATDTAGNTAEAESTLRVDRAPTLAFVAPAEMAVVAGEVQVQVDAADDLQLAAVDLEVDGFFYGSFDGDGLLTWTPPYTAGVVTLTAVATDGAGQVTRVERMVEIDHPLELTLRLCVDDACAPLEPDAEVTGAVRVEVEAHDDDGPPARVVVLVDDDRLLDARMPPFAVGVDTTAYVDGAHDIVVSAVGASGALADLRVPVRVNNCDLDHDGFAARGPACGGRDCDDGDATVNPEADDLEMDGTDQNCDGRDGPEPDAGIDMGVDLNPPDGGLPPQEYFGPATRTSALDFPADVAAARAAGCAVVGSNAGTTLRSWLGQLRIDSLQPFVELRPNGSAPIFNFSVAKGFNTGDTLATVGAVDLWTMAGVRDSARNLVNPISLVDPEAELPEPRLMFPAVAIAPDGSYRTDPGSFLLPFPVGNDIIIDINLRAAQLSGRLILDGPGYGFVDGLIEGYWIEEDIVAWFGQVQAACLQPGAPAICTTLLFVLPPGTPPATIISTLRQFFGGFDTAWVDGQPVACGGPDQPICDSVSVCLQAAGEGSVLHAVEGALEDPCLVACDPLADCATWTGDSTCGALTPGHRLLVRRACTRACAAGDFLAEQLHGQATCAERVQFGRDRIAGFGVLCDGP